MERFQTSAVTAPVGDTVAYQHTRCRPRQRSHTLPAQPDGSVAANQGGDEAPTARVHHTSRRRVTLRLPESCRVRMEPMRFFLQLICDQRMASCSTQAISRASVAVRHHYRALVATGWHMRDACC